jgi:hypothetical protein
MAKATTISISGKTSDLFSATLYDSEGHSLGDYEGYVPDFFPGEHYGDYIILEIELATGKILNWKPPTQDQLDECHFAHPGEEEEEAVEPENLACQGK